MALQRLRETFIISPKDWSYKVVSDDKLSKDLKETYDKQTLLKEQELLGLYSKFESLRESFPNKTLFDKTLQSLRENSERKYKTYEFPVGRYGNKNHNKRIYTKKLWENVRDKQKDQWLGLAGMADHPPGDENGEWKYSTIVWLDMRIGNDGVVYGTGRFVGPYGGLAQDILDVGGRLGFSSSGFGDVNSEGVVDPETYQIERLADVVLAPSQNVYGTETNETNKPNIEYEQKVKESIKEAAGKSAIIRSKTMKIDAANPNEQADPNVTVSQPVQENTNVNKALSKVEEKAFRKYVESFMTQASEIKNPSERLKEMADVLEMFEDGVAPDLRERFYEALIEERNGLEQLIESATNIQESFEADSLEEIEENAKKIALQGSLLAEQTVDQKTLIEALTNRNRELIKKLKVTETKLSLKEAKLDRYEKKVSTDRVTSSMHTDALNEECSDYKNRLKIREKEIAKLSETNNQLEKTISLKESQIADLNKKIKIREQLVNTKSVDKNENDKVLADLKETIKTQEGRIERLQAKLLQERKEKEIAQTEFNSYRTKIQEETTPELHILPKFEKRVSGMLNFRENAGVEIEEYWGTLVQRYGESVLPFEKSIRAAKTLREAKNAFMRNRNLIDEDFGLADNARAFEGSSIREKGKILSESGMNNDTVLSLEERNAAFLENARKWGLM